MKLKKNVFYSKHSGVAYTGLSVLSGINRNNSRPPLDLSLASIQCFCALNCRNIFIYFYMIHFQT